ncbi:TPA: hypothetical protein L4A36_002046 [Pseudomonas aeruginosa]|nr:hypothetical protein [Pseudomonas aeruginosa]HBP1486262.1 hypothetical protein [Pseudomonas aeruginosa]
MGHKKTCDRVAAELTTAFRDGEFVGKGLYDALAAEARALREERDSQQRVAINAMEELAALRARVVSESDIFASVQAVRDRYPVVVFPSDGASVDCKSAAMARVVCDAVMKELSILFNQDKENGNG